MAVTFNNLLLALSHSCNLIIYCLSSRSILSTVCAELFGTNPSPNTERIPEAMRTVTECVLDVQELVERNQEDIKGGRRSSTTHLMLQSKNLNFPRRTCAKIHPLSYLDLAVNCSCKNINGCKEAFSRKQSIAYQTFEGNKNVYNIYLVSNAITN